MGNLQIFDCAQGTPEWHACRLGIATCSMFATVMAKGKTPGAISVTRRAYLLRLAGEVITGEPAETYSNGHMERGKTMEDEARELYAFHNDVEPVRVGFIRNGAEGCSPDSLIGASGGLEIKTALPHILIEYLLKGEFPPAHRAQVQGSLLVAERDWWDLRVYWPKITPFDIRSVRDEPYIANLRGELDRFNDELAATVEQVRRYGQTVAKAA